MIVLVVFGHAWRGLASHGSMTGELFSAVDNRIYAFHMPTFFALSGWFFISSLERKPLFEFYQSRVLRLFVPMVLWTYIFLATKALAGQYTNAPIGWGEVLVSPIPGMLHMWFLWALLVLSVVFSFLKLFSKEGRITDTAVWFAVALVVVVQFIPLTDVANDWVGEAIRNAPFFLIGLISGRMIPLHQMPPVFRALAVLVFTLILVALPFLQGFASPFLVSFSLTVCVLVVVAGYGAETESRIGKFLIMLGIASMPIFLAHTIFSASMREAFFAIGLDNLWFHIALGTIVGIAGPLVLMRLVRGYKVARVFGF